MCRCPAPEPAAPAAHRQGQVSESIGGPAICWTVTSTSQSVDDPALIRPVACPVCTHAGKLGSFTDGLALSLPYSACTRALRVGAHTRKVVSSQAGNILPSLVLDRREVHELVSRWCYGAPSSRVPGGLGPLGGVICLTQQRAACDGHWRDNWGCIVYHSCDQRLRPFPIKDI